MQMRKIAIIGSAGAGKSSLARTLGLILLIKVIHLDRYFWQPGWKEMPRDAWIEKQKELLQGEQWIIDGTYSSTVHIRLNAADTIIFLDMPRLLCIWRVIIRHFLYAKRQRCDFSESCLDKLSFSYILKVWNFPHTDRKTLVKKIRALELGPEKQIIWLRSRRKVSKFLRQMQRNELQKQSLRLRDNDTKTREVTTLSANSQEQIVEDGNQPLLEATLAKALI